MNTMKKTVASGILVGAALLGGALLGPGTANASTDSVHDPALVYLQMLNNDGIVVTNTAGAIRAGMNMCTELSAGYTPVQIAYQAYTAVPSYTTKDAADDLFDAVTVFCPQYLSSFSTPELPAVPSVPSSPSGPTQTV